MKRAFTLIELLVVIAIVAILAALLLPALVEVRRNASRAVCMNNERLMGIKYHAYRTDHGRWPRAGSSSGECLALLYPEYADTLKIFNCPAAGLPDASLQDAEIEDSDYVQDTGIPATVRPTRGVYGDHRGNHHEGSNLLFAGLHVRWCPEVDGRVSNPQLEADTDIYTDAPALGTEKDCYLLSP